MNERTIKKYAAMMEDLNLSALEITRFGQKVRLERTLSDSEKVIVASAATPHAQVSAADSHKPAPVEDDTVFTLTSPMIGAFYAAPAENQEPFVNEGDRVKVGDILCIIESMKLMNEIRSEVAGTIIETCAANHQAVDFGHPLFRIRLEA